MTCVVWLSFGWRILRALSSEREQADSHDIRIKSPRFNDHEPLHNLE